MASSTGKKLIKIDVSSDTVCPWCFVGKKNLDKAMEQTMDKFDFEVCWHPFFLNPDAPKEGVKKSDFYKTKFGPVQFERATARMTEMFRGLGFEYDMSGLMQVLVNAARKVGIEGAEELLQDPSKGVDEVKEDLSKYSSGIFGVPHFVINGKYQLSGGQPSNIFMRTFEAAAKNGAE
ncbi:hypothetical protein ACQ4PT_001464 [Festuca glaucescens]